MAFVFRAKKASSLETNGIAPGPGAYIAHQGYTYEPSRVPFHTTAEREPVKVPYDSVPGPGSYDVATNIVKPDKTANIFFVPAGINGETEETKGTSNFKSRAPRFEKQVLNENPGPGAYNKDRGFGIQGVNHALMPKSNKLQQVQAMLRAGQTVIPSIPSNAHTYGYTENDEHKLMLNKNPVMEVQEFVGPGYYDVKNTMTMAKPKGVAWSKSQVQKIGEFNQATATSNFIGPGTYQTNVVSMPSYQHNLNSGFASSTVRSFDSRVKRKLGGFAKTTNRTTYSSNTDYDRHRLSAAETNADEDDSDNDEYIKDATPGPGHYSNDSWISSFSSLRSPDALSNASGDSRIRGFPKPAKPQAFGATKRFQTPAQNNELGPGEYDPGSLKNPDLKYTKVPFQSSNTRFDRQNLISHPGPGAYDPSVNLVDRINEKGKKGYVGSFGVTDKRFKISKLLEDTPGPGSYQAEVDKANEDITTAFRKGSHFFNSKLDRSTFDNKNTTNTGPGTYTVKYYDIATKTKKPDEEDAEQLKKHPFGVGQARFEKPKEKPIPEHDDEDDDDDDDDEPRYGPSQNLEALLKSKMKAKPNAVFASKTGRTIGGVQPKVIPGPGAYHDGSLNTWNRRTFNIHFTGD